MHRSIRKHSPQAPFKLVKRLNVAIRLVDNAVQMIEIDVRHHKIAVLLQKFLPYLGKFLLLKLADIFKHTLRDNNVEYLLCEP